ncbi:uncharacterized protein LOC128233024 [Mya arenaria]|uniref:uncharacterized protein LOC128233024 n=1 Tax=Mya arenaria TaxID=6604 RepID=UPI0022E20BA9|nr:uncharacterized protein LOC128233024 [Mya arenaria]
MKRMHIITKYLCVIVLFFDNFTICAKINEHQAIQNQTLKIRQIMKMAQEYRVRRAKTELIVHPHYASNNTINRHDAGDGRVVTIDGTISTATFSYGTYNDHVGTNSTTTESDESSENELSGNQTVIMGSGNNTSLSSNNTINKDHKLEEHPNQKTNTLAGDGLDGTIPTATVFNVTYNDHVGTNSTTTESDTSSENELTEISGNRTTIMTSGNNTSPSLPSQAQAPSSSSSSSPPSSSSSSAFSPLFSAASSTIFSTATTFKVTAPSSSIVTTKSSSSLTETNVKARRRTTTTTTIKPFIPSSTSTTLLKSALTQATARAITVPALSFSHKLTNEPKLKTDDITLHPCVCDDNSLSGNFYTGSSVASATVGGVFLGAFTMILIFYIRGKCRRHFNGDYRRVPIEYDFELNPNLRHR